jgi:feruloyl esterase
MTIAANWQAGKAVATPTRDHRNTLTVALTANRLVLPLCCTVPVIMRLGGGGYTGSINYTSLATALRANFAAANTDMGTAPATGGNGSAIVGHPEKFLDFGSRSTHEMTVAAKTLVQAFYGQPAQYSYFVGCSTGGHQGLEEAQVFPNDYDGILAGAPGHNRTHLHTAFVWDYAVPRKPGASLISPAKLTSLNNAVLAACVGSDGGVVTDRYLTDPRDCTFDPASLLCSGANAPTCLTASELQTARLFYDGPRNPRTGQRIYPGWALGSELGWTALQGTTQPDFEGIYKWALDANYDPLAVDFDADMAKVDAVLAPSVNFMSSDLSRFASAGGKLLLYHGFADPIVVSQDTINYFERIMSEQHLTPAQTQAFVRLFMVPGIGAVGGDVGRRRVFDQARRTTQPYILRRVHLHVGRARSVEAGIMDICRLVVDDLLLDWRRARIALDRRQPAVHHEERLPDARCARRSAGAREERANDLIVVLTIGPIEAIALGP